MIYVFWIAITTDGWTSRATESYITVTSTLINKNWELENYILQTRTMPENHTGMYFYFNNLLRKVIQLCL